MPKSGESLLLLDASGPESHVGIIRDHEWLARRKTEEPALESLFANISECLKETGLGIGDINGYLYCDGPGSMLGLRLSSLAIRTWLAMPTFHASVTNYHRLHIAAVTSQLPVGSLLITEFKEKRWHALKVTENLSHESPIVSLEQEALSSVGTPVFYLKQRKTWQTLPCEHMTVSYQLNDLPRLLKTHPELFFLTDNPVPFVRESSEYQTWNATRHA